MADQKNGRGGSDDEREPRVHDKRKIDPETGEARESGSAHPDDAHESPTEADGATDASGPDAPGTDAKDASADAEETDGLSPEDAAILDDAERDLVAEYRDRAARAEAELVNFRNRVERDRQANREAVIAEVIRSLLPAIDDLDRAEAHGDLADGSPLAIVAQKLRGGFERYGLKRVGEKGETFDPRFHEALVRIPTEGATGETVGDVIEVGYALGDRLIRAAKVAVFAPAD